MVSRLVSIFTVEVRMFAKTPDFVHLQRIHNPLNIATILASIHHDSSNAELEIFITFNEGAGRANRDS